MSRTSTVTADEFLKSYSLELRRLAHATRKRIMAVVPQATERVRVGWRLIGYNAPAYFAFIALDLDRVRIGFEWGVMLQDPKELLVGTGSQVRYVEIRSETDLRRAALRDLLSQAAAIRPPMMKQRGLMT